ncbi:MAG: hypothetical protein LAO24_00105 [Acidobacteriia bacterium]|nr:hypothetical protein [Terriglobia bacterium]
MEILTPKATRRSTRLRVEIPVSVTSLDRMHPFAEKCVAIVVSCQGCGIRSSSALSTGTPILLSDLPAGGSVTARVASCLPLGKDSSHFLIGAALYTHGNVWGIDNPPDDWNVTPQPAADSVPASHAPASHKPSSRQAWPYNLFSAGTEAPLSKK